jgi:hypothetical protein
LSELFLKGEPVARANRTAWEREKHLDDIYGVGVAVLPRHKFVYLADQWNMCPSVYRNWLDHWREYCDDQNEDLGVLIVGSQVVLWRMASEEVSPKALSAALAAAN